MIRPEHLLLRLKWLAIDVEAGAAVAQAFSAMTMG